MRYALRLISFASATACAIFSLIGVFLLLTGCNYAHHRFPPSVKILVSDNPYRRRLLYIRICLQVVHTKFNEASKPTQPSEPYSGAFRREPIPGSIGFSQSILHLTAIYIVLHSILHDR